MHHPSIPSVTVFCGSSPGARPAYAEAARELATLLAGADVAIVCGGSAVGLMGVLAEASREAGGVCVGVSPRFLVEFEPPSEHLSSLVLTETLDERKAVLLRDSAAVLVLPGGVGTLDEAFEALTLKQLGRFAGPVVFVDVEEHWSPLDRLLNHLWVEGFVSDSSSHDHRVVGGVAAALDAIAPALELAARGR